MFGQRSSKSSDLPLQHEILNPNYHPVIKHDKLEGLQLDTLSKNGGLPSRI
jgi:hypothetical protein